MPIIFNDNTATLEEVVTIEESEAFYEWMQTHPEGVVDLKALTHIHTCNLQLLMVMKPKISEFPNDSNLRGWLDLVQVG